MGSVQQEVKNSVEHSVFDNQASFPSLDGDEASFISNLILDGGFEGGDNWGLVGVEFLTG